MDVSHLEHIKITVVNSLYNIYEIKSVFSNAIPVTDNSIVNYSYNMGVSYKNITPMYFSSPLIKLILAGILFNLSIFITLVVSNVTSYFYYFIIKSVSEINTKSNTSNTSEFKKAKTSGIDKNYKNKPSNSNNNSGGSGGNGGGKKNPKR